MNRRKFVRTVIAGMTAAGVPFQKVYSEAPGRSHVRTNRRHVVRGTAHQLRDGHRFAPPPPAEFKDVVIVGAGPNSLFAAYHLPDLEVLCLEKEPRCGGNAQRSKWCGIYFTEGAAYTSVSSALTDFMESEFSLKPTPIDSDLGYVAGTTLIPDFYYGGFDKLPFDAAIRSEFSRFRDACVDTRERLRPALGAFYENRPVEDAALAREIARLEAMSFEQWLLDGQYPQEVIDWCDRYCPTDVNAYPRDMSAISGVTSMGDIGDFDGSGSYPGGLAAMAEAVEAGVRAQGANRIRNGAFVVSVTNKPDGRHVDVTYLQSGILHTVRCKACIWGAQKHIAAHVIREMPEEQVAAIARLKYNDISVINMCYERRIYDGAYITWLDGAPINNFLPADWVLTEGHVDPDSPQVLTCDWTNRPEHRALLLNDDWVVEQCQLSAQRLDEIFPGSLDSLVEMRLPLRAHSWVTHAPKYWSEIKPAVSKDIGRVVMTESDHNSFAEAYRLGVKNAEAVREWVA